MSMKDTKGFDDDNRNDITNISINTINEKFYSDKLDIDELLLNDNCTNDLLSNQKSRFKKLLTLDNIIKLINNCLKPNFLNYKDFKTLSRIIFYSSEILCSSSGLLFEKSIKLIKSNEKKNTIDNNNLLDLSNDNGTEINTEKVVEKEQDYIKDNQNDSTNQDNMTEDFYENDEYGKDLEIENDLEEKYKLILKDNMIPTESQIEKNKRKTLYDYEDDEKKMINKILDEIFQNLTIENYYNDQTYMGYFQKIVNYILFNECNLTINYILNNSNRIFKTFYNQLSCSSMQNILENILNIISDKEEEIYCNKYLEIINDLIDLLGKEIQDNKLEKLEYICQIIIDTIINNSEKQLIKCFFENEDAMKKIIGIIERIISLKEKNDKQLIFLIKLLCQLNSVILNSLEDWNLYDFNKEDKDYFLNENILINTFENQYKSEKKITKKNIFKKYQEKSEQFISNLNIIYYKIKEDIKQNYNNNIKNSNNTKFGLKHLNEWKFILSYFKIYIFTIYITKKEEVNYLNDKKYFYDKELFNISISLYFHFVKNNLYQNIFVNLIKLLCLKKCPDFLAREFLCNKDEVYYNDLITLILKNIKKNVEENAEEKKKQNLLIAPNIEILKTIFYSYNYEISQFIKKTKLYDLYKEIYLNSLESKFERKLDEDYSFNFSEIFSSQKFSQTFDGNESGVEIESVRPIQKEIEHFIDKCYNIKELKKIVRYIFIEKEYGRYGSKIKKEIIQKTMPKNIIEKKAIIEYEYPPDDNIEDVTFTLERKINFYME